MESKGRRQWCRDIGILIIGVVVRPYILKRCEIAGPKTPSIVSQYYVNFFKPVAPEDISVA